MADMGSENLVSCEQLRIITGYKRSSDVERCLREQGVKVFWSRKGPWTTVDLINNAGGMAATQAGNDKYGADAIL